MRKLISQMASGLLFALMSSALVTCSFNVQENFILNGDFEAGNTSGWLRDRTPGGIVVVQTAVVHGGSYALKIDTLTGWAGDFVYQGVSVLDASFDFRFWIYRESGRGHEIMLLRDWDMSGPAYAVTGVFFWEDSVTFLAWSESRTTWDMSVTVPYVLSSGQWHVVDVKADSTSKTQALLIDGALIAEQTSTVTYVPEWILMGDLSGQALRGLFYYDDISLSLAAPRPISATLFVSPETVNIGSGGRWVTSYIQLPEEYQAGDIDPATISLNGTISPVLDAKFDFVTNSSEYLADHDGDGISERMVKFDRASMESFIRSQGNPNGSVTLTITGRLFDGSLFVGTDITFVFYGGAGGRRK